MECYGQGSHGSRIVDWLGLLRAFRARPAVFFNPTRAGYGRAALHYCLNGDPLGLLLFPDRSL